MQDSQILSAFHELTPPSAPRLEDTLVFDACHVGVVLRSVLLVELTAMVAAMFGAAGFFDWLTRTGVLTAAALPGTLAWLVAACLLKRQLARLPDVLQMGAGVLLGALSGAYGCGLLALGGFVTRPPWLASACAGALVSALMVVALYMRAQGRTPADTAARLTELQSRIRPHFLFNTLNSAIALVRDEPAKAEAMLEDLSDLFRHALIDQGESVSLADEILLAQRYLAIEEVRFGERLQVEWALDPAAGRARVPPLLLQPLVENAVKHGVEPSPDGAQVRVSTERRGDMVLIKVTNTVPPVPGRNARGHGIALDNVRDRLHLLHDVQGSFRAAARNGVFQVRIEIPA